MRRGILGSIAALAAGAGAAWGQAPMPLPPAGAPPAAVAPGGPPGYDTQPGFTSGPAPVLMPPLTVGPPGDPQGLGPTASLGPPPGPMYPPPGPYGAPLFQPAPPAPNGVGYGAAPTIWVNGDYLLWFAKNQPVRFPLLTTSAPNQLGLLNFPSTIELVPAQDINYNAISGLRLSAGFFGDADRRFGAEANGFYTENKTVNQFFSTSPGGQGGVFGGVIGGGNGLVNVGIPLLARPFIDTTTGPSSLVVANLGQGTGSALISTSTQTWSAEGLAVWNVFRSAPTTKWWMSLDFLGGYKYFQLKEDLDILSSGTFNAVNVVPIFQVGPFGTLQLVGTRIVPILFPVDGTVAGAPATVQVADRFKTTNMFNGGTLGFRSELRYGMFSLTTVGKVGIGDMHQVLEIQGSTSFVDPNPVFGSPRAGSAYGGLFANASNIGRFHKDEFAVIPEIDVNLGINLTKQLSMHVGYDFLYVSRVIRPASQINPIVDASTVPLSPTYGALGAVPGTRVLFNETSYWLTGVNFGFTFKY